MSIDHGSSDDEIRQLARDWHASDDLQIDDDARVSRADLGCWVQAWVWVPWADADDLPATSRLAPSSGWAILDANGVLRLQRIDEGAVFASDEAAWVWVWLHARSGHARCVAALAQLERASPEEYARIRAHCTDLGARQ